MRTAAGERSVNSFRSSASIATKCVALSRIWSRASMVATHASSTRSFAQPDTSFQQRSMPMVMGADEHVRLRAASRS